MIRWLKRSAWLLLILVAAVVLTAWWLIRGSLPRLDGEVALLGLSAPVSIQRDKLGVVTIDAANETDAMRALGYVHAQERFFEMDLMRRTAAGELAELFGSIALDTDKQHRIHRMRARVMENLDAIAGDKLPQLQAYVDGVNAGLGDLEARPWPYLLLRQHPEPWLLADSALTGYAMYFDLQDSTNARELALSKIEQHVPPTLFALLTRDGTSWDAPLMGRPHGDAVLPTVDQLDLRKLPAPPATERGALALIALPDKPEVGSNNFAVSGALTKDGRAIVADDMHLGLRAPNIWFRARLRYADARATNGEVDVSGFTLPGLPVVIVGSNRHLAWGFTNSYIDTADWYAAKCVAGVSPGDCRKKFQRSSARYLERIDVAGDRAAEFEVWERDGMPSIWDDTTASARMLHWAADDAGSLNLRIMDLAHASGADEAVQISRKIAMPHQNLVFASSNGEIGWMLVGALARKTGGASPAPCATFMADTPPRRMLADSRAADGTWHGQTVGVLPGRNGYCTPGIPHFQIDPDVANPMALDPVDGHVWTANNRVVDGAMLEQVGDAGYALGARARQIRDDLFARPQFTERDLLAVQLDDRALFLQRWWALLRDDGARAKTPAMRELAAASAGWPDRANADSVSYRIVRAWRLAVHERIADGLTAPAQAALGEDFEMPSLSQLEGVAWPMVTQRPTHLLPRRFSTWDALFEDAAMQVRDELAKQGPLSKRTWGERNTAAICHPLAGAIPLIGKRWLCMPPDQLAGDSNMPRVAAPAFGASERMVVSPGHEADGIVHMPGGQSGNPLSPFWGAGHDDWVHGRPTPFLPGKTEYTLRLAPP